MSTQIKSTKSKKTIKISKRNILRSASSVLVGGVNSPVRAFRQVGADPVFLSSGKGALVKDIAGRSYVDFIMGWGALLLGHNAPVVLKAQRSGISRSVTIGLTQQCEVELASLITESVSSVEQVRFTVSGTEACLTAVRLSRGYTNRSKIVVFDGCYHGHGDSCLSGMSAGIPELLAQDTLHVPYNDFETLEETMHRYGDHIAAVIIESVTGNMGVVVPEPGFLSKIRSLTKTYGSLFILDEVITGFRLSSGGAQKRFGIKPDLTTFGKIIGGGMPIGALGGPRSIMKHLSPDGAVFHGGTFAGHPMSMMAGTSALKEIMRLSPYERLENITTRLALGLQAAATDAGVTMRVEHFGSMLSVFFTQCKPHNAEEVNATNKSQFSKFANGLRKEGILIPPSSTETLFVSTAHTDGYIDSFIKAAKRVLKRI